MERMCRSTHRTRPAGSRAVGVKGAAWRGGPGTRGPRDSRRQTESGARDGGVSSEQSWRDAVPVRIDIVGVSDKPLNSDRFIKFGYFESVAITIDLRCFTLVRRWK